MNAQRIAIGLGIANLALLFLLVLVIGTIRPIVTGDVLRARSLQIVDAQGRVRVSIAVLPRDPNVTFEGKVYPETVLLRMSDPVAGPDVKISVNEDGGGFFAGGGNAASYVQIGADDRSGWVKLVTRDLSERELRP